MTIDREGSKYSIWRPCRARKRKAVENDHKNNVLCSTSAKKLKNFDFNIEVNPLVEYCIVSFALIFPAIAKLVICKKCHGKINFLKSEQRGLGFYLHFKCPCDEIQLKSSPFIKNAFEINRKIVLVFRMLGVSYQGLLLFCSMMDITQTFSKNTYYGVLHKIHAASKLLFQTISKKAIKEEI